ncbi:SpoIIE family protein phosphatase [Noviherbaspirillum sp. ST9]|uniref:SpoIIE family protein phosphatase n=1 Tax=Noviherbaspirillum sp. ST9 TaxID=3401606 RepID=UPI003B586021
MVTAPIPPDEAQRLQNLDSYQLLDTPFEAVFDEIASLAARICNVPYAMISLVDSKRQWFKAVHGMQGPRETPRDISFCGHAIVHDEVFYVPDALADERFHDNPFVTGELSIRVYAGMPLASEEGYKLGTLCVLSDRPTALSEAQLESLKQLSHVLKALFSARKKEARLAVLGQVLDQLDDEIMLADPLTFACTYANLAAHKAYLPEGSLAGMRLSDIAQTDGNDQHRQLIDSFQSGTANSIRLELPRGNAAENGEPERVVELRLQRLVTGHGAKVVLIGHDISERKKLDQVKAELHANLERHHQEMSHAYRQLSDELAIAREMQLRFLPSPKHIGDVCFDWLFRASSYIGGDIFDYFPLDERHLCFHVIDVSGHGVSAALLAFAAQRQMFSARSETRALIHRLDGDIASAASFVVQEFNQRFAAMNESSLYLTLIFGILDTHTGETALVQAGHPPPLLSKPGEQSLQAVGEGGLPIGILDHVEYEANVVRMTPGSRLYLYSDGVTECPNASEEMFGRERLERLLTQNPGAPLHAVREALDSALEEWRGGNDSFEDDVTFLTVEYGLPNQHAPKRVRQASGGR